MPIVAQSGANQDHHPHDDDDDEGESSNNANGILDLDPTLWKNIPHELLEKVHLCLPLVSLARFRSVCRAWNHIVFDEGFIRSRHNFTQKPWIVITSTANSISIYDTGFETWLRLPIPFNATNLHVVAAAGGLLCFSNAWFQWPGMAVLNPVTNSWRRLPPMSTWMITTVGMVYNDTTNSYKILVCGRLEDHSMITEVYDSATGRWAPGGIPSAAKKYGGDTLVWRDGIFYCLTFPFSTLSLIAYDLNQGTWHEVPVTMPSPIMSPSVVVCNSSLLLVGGVEEQDGEFSIQIWELEFQTLVWEEVETMPALLCREFESRMVPSKPFSCFGTGEFLFLTIPSNTAYLPALVYDLKLKTWSWWPSQGFPPQLPEINIGRSSGFSFEPRLHALV
ncbi:hypothetical protein M758_2G240400 [Ceratodon purpureus]|nr:hypothetical protein M758_2G240400 [Ceratodon purpureus]